MGSRTVALQDSTYERLKAARRQGESFTEAVDRLLEGKEPSLLDFVGLIPKKDADELGRVIEGMRADDARVERLRWGRNQPAARRGKHGRNV
jgi:predicted CopG family antitoxin